MNGEEINNLPFKERKEYAINFGDLIDVKENEKLKKNKKIKNSFTFNKINFQKNYSIRNKNKNNEKDRNKKLVNGSILFNRKVTIKNMLNKIIEQKNNGIEIEQLEKNIKENNFFKSKNHLKNHNLNINNDEENFLNIYHNNYKLQRKKTNRFINSMLKKNQTLNTSIKKKVKFKHSKISENLEKKEKEKEKYLNDFNSFLQNKNNKMLHVNSIKNSNINNSFISFGIKDNEKKETNNNKLILNKNKTQIKKNLNLQNNQLKPVKTKILLTTCIKNNDNNKNKLDLNYISPFFPNKKSNKLLKYSSLISNTLMKNNGKLDEKSRILFGSEKLILKNLEREERLQNFIEFNYRKLIKSSFKVYDSLSEREQLLDIKLIEILPNSKFFYFWSFILNVFLFYIAIVSPYYISFIYNFNIIYFIIELIIDIFFIFDIIIHFFIPYPNDENEDYVLKTRLIILNYLKKWFFFDFIISIPYATILNLFFEKKEIKYYNHIEILNLLKFIKLLKIFKLIFNKYLLNERNISFLDEIFKSTKKSRLFMFAIIFLIANHFLSCIFCFLGSLDFPNWISKNNIDVHNNFEKYMVAMYYNFKTIFSIGYGNVYIVSNFEFLYNIILQTFGLFIYSFLLSNIMLLLKKTQAQENLDKKLNLLDDISIEFSVNTKLYYKIYKFLIIEKQITKYNRIEFLKDLPVYLRNDLIEKMYKDILQFKFFKNTNFDFISRIILNFHPFKANQGEYLIQKDKYFDDIYFISDGRISIECTYRERIIKISELTKGENFGEINLLLNKKSEFDLVVKSKIAEILFLNKETLIEVAADYNDIFNEKQKISILNLTLFERKLKRKKKEINNEINKRKFFIKKNAIKKMKKTLIRKSNIIEEVIEEVSENSERDSSSYEKNKESKKEVNYLYDRDSKDSFKDNKNKNRSTNELKKDTRKLRIKKSLSREISPITFNIDKGNRDSIQHNATFNSNFKKRESSSSKLNNIIQKNKRTTLLINKNISQGNLTLNNPNLFYLNLFNKLTMEDQNKRIKNLYNFLKDTIK